MSRFIITLSGKGIRQTTADKFVEELRKKYGEGASVTVQKKEVAESRAARLGEAINDIQNAKSEIESIRDEMQEIVDNTPENLQGSEKYAEREECVNALDELISQLEEAVQHEVSFPGMY